MSTSRARVTEFLSRETGPMTFGKFVIAARALLGLSQSELARKLKVSRSMICDIEKGRTLVSIALAARIAKIAGFPADFAVTYAVLDQLRKAKLKMKVEVKAA